MTPRCWAAFALLILAAGCSEPVTPARVGAVRVLAPADSVFIGSTLQLTAQVRDADGRELTGRPLRWRSSAPDAAAVDSVSGLVTALAEGEASITVESGGQRDSLVLRVQPQVQVTCTPGQAVVPRNASVTGWCTLTMRAPGPAQFALATNGSTSGITVAPLTAGPVSLLPGQTLELPVAITASGEAPLGSTTVTLRATAATVLGSFALGLTVAEAGPVVRAVYLVASDREPRAGMADSLDHALRRVQTWYQDKMGMGRTFAIHPAVQTYRLPNTAQWYRTPQRGDDLSYSFNKNVQQDAMPLTGAQQNDPNTIWVFVADVPSSGNGANIVGNIVSLDGFYLESIAGIPGRDGQCAGTGILAHGLGGAFGLGGPVDTPGTIMQEFWKFPALILSAQQIAKLSSSRFFRAEGSTKAPSCAPRQ